MTSRRGIGVKIVYKREIEERGPAERSGKKFLRAKMEIEKTMTLWWKRSFGGPEYQRLDWTLKL